MLIADAGGAPPAGPGIPGPGIPVSVLTAMRFHWVTEVASAVAGGAADAPRTPSAPKRAPTATAINKTDRVPGFLRCIRDAPFSDRSPSTALTMRHRLPPLEKGPPNRPVESIRHSSYLWWRCGIARLSRRGAAAALRPRGGATRRTAAAPPRSG